MELINGQCESCGYNYKMIANLSKEVICKKCDEKTQNFDTVKGTLMAPSVVSIS